ncbi:MAG TPA: PIN domain-containing protein, partial [Segetibacter sp.]
MSFLIQRSYPYLIIFELFIENKFQLCVSDEVMKEYYNVLARPKFKKVKDFFVRAESLLAD